MHSGEERLGDGDLALLVRRFPAVNDLTLRFASRLTVPSYEILGEVRKGPGPLCAAASWRLKKQKRSSLAQVCKKIERESTLRSLGNIFLLKLV